MYKLIVDTRNINPDKKDVFVNLLSIYSDISKKEILKRINSRFGSVILSYKIDSKKAKYLKELSRKMYLFGVFKTYEDKKRGVTFLHGLDVVESGEYRIYPYKEILAPTLGYIKKFEHNALTKVTGVKGIEKFYNDTLKPLQDGVTLGKKDVLGKIILDKTTKRKPVIDGYNLHLNIDIKLQKLIENILDTYKEDLQAKEIVAAIMHSKTGQMLSLVSSNRFNPKRIKRSQYPNLNSSAVEFTYEPGSVMKPITFALLLQHKLINPYDIIRTYNGRYKLGDTIITDTHQEEWLSAQNVIVYSSNVGTVQLAQKLTGVNFYYGLQQFGFGEKTNLDLPYEKVGSIPRIQQLDDEVYKGTVGYGYGMKATFMQVLKAFNVFNNNGYMVQPHIAQFLNNKLQSYKLKFDKPKKVIPMHIAKQMQQILIKVVQKGTGRNARVSGLQIGGKTGTSHIASKQGGYDNLYNSSFFGFANGSGDGYTIGVLVREPLKEKTYFASQTAVPIFAKIAQLLVDEGYLKKFK
jgi:cell division protein FtsI (penicillin-binding protein 3)